MVPVWQDQSENRSFAVFYLPPTGGIWALRPRFTEYAETGAGADVGQTTLRNDSFKKAVAHAEEFIYGSRT